MLESNKECAKGLLYKEGLNSDGQKLHNINKTNNHLSSQLIRI
jgi:hypothetical protein